MLLSLFVDSSASIRNRAERRKKEYEEALNQLKDEIEREKHLVITMPKFAGVVRVVAGSEMASDEEIEKIISDDTLINEKRWEIEEKCINLIATQQPVAWQRT